MERVMWVDYLTLRATYGLSGNQPAKAQFIATAYEISSMLCILLIINAIHSSSKTSS
jgi:hypothetical protein